MEGKTGRIYWWLVGGKLPYLLVVGGREDWKDLLVVDGRVGETYWWLVEGKTGRIYWWLVGG
jgi:hypothetical protein